MCSIDMKDKILLVPYRFYTDQSGAIAAREAARILSKMGYIVGIFSEENPKENLYNYFHFKSESITRFVNVINLKYKHSFINTLEYFNPKYVFFIGGIINTPLIYLDIAKKKGLTILFLHFMQDFYCARLHAGLNLNSCTKCLDGSKMNALLNNCLEKGRIKLLYFVKFQYVNYLFKYYMKNIDYWLGSSEEQIMFYKKLGVSKEKCIKIPLFFDKDRIQKKTVAIGDYFVIMAQNRHEKGIHLISKILEHVNEKIKIKMLFYNDKEANSFLKNFPENKRYIEKGILSLHPNITITNGGAEIMAGARGVIIPSIWATTTEYVFLEALALSKPVIAFAVGIHKEKIKSGINGILVNPGDFKGMANGINNLYFNKKLYTKISSNSTELYDELTNDEIYISILKNIFIK